VESQKPVAEKKAECEGGERRADIGSFDWNEAFLERFESEGSSEV
jgi:hypothetical protein